ncbi:uncharacterized protein K444DRAFT_504953, partial [Hyaloscypha bicolor E]
REAKESDIEAISEIALLSMSLDPAWTYRYQFAKIYPIEHKENTRNRYDKYLADQREGRFCIVVAELLLHIKDETITKVIAFAIWQLPRTLLKAIDEAKPNIIEPTSDYLDRKDVSPARMKAFRAYRKVKLHWFDEKYGEKQWSLMTLATHPDYGRGGVGTALCYWAIQRAISDKIEAVTLFASPLGKLLYTKLKFIVVGIVRIQVEGEEEFVDLPGM